jgi:hypothetical protein
MGYSARNTESLRTYLQKHPEHKFTASDLKEGTGIPKKFVRRALTVDAEGVAEDPMPDVGMERKKGRWYFWWNG